VRNINITGKTRVCGIIGDPIEHTLSPVMQNAAFREMGLDYIYLPFKVAEGNLSEAIDGLRALNMAGINVTIPHKVVVMPLLDDIDGLAGYIGAVNTIVNQGGSLKGYNTDASGFYQALTANKIVVSKKKIVILGAGGASRAIAFILADKGAELTILNRSLDSAQTIAERVFQALRTEIKVGKLTVKNLEPVLDEADILVNTTSLGMSPDLTETPVPARLLKKELVVFDIIYNPLKTRLIKEAEKEGARVLNGLEMLVRQGAAAFELWTDLKAPIEVMRKAARDAMEENEK
jgi:shikimate dehydrogenase